MEKQQLLIKFMEVAESAKPDKKERHFEGERKREDKEREGSGKNKHGKLKMPPSARSILSILLKEERLNQRTIAKITNITAQGVSDCLRKLERDELISREAGEVHNENFITLTEKGIETAKRIDKNTKERAELMFGDFSEEEMDVLSKMLEKMKGNNASKW